MSDDIIQNGLFSKLSGTSLEFGALFIFEWSELSGLRNQNISLKMDQYKDSTKNE